MTRWLPRPLLSVALLAGWLALNGGSAAQAALGLVLALAIPLLAAPLRPASGHRLRGLPALKLLVRLLRDVIVANVRVARLVLGRMDALRPAFVTVPLELRTEQAVTLLARIVTITPGTATLGIDRKRRCLLVHVLHTEQPEDVVMDIKTRYERLLLEIFE